MSGKSAPRKATYESAKAGTVTDVQNLIRKEVEKYVGPLTSNKDAIDFIEYLQVQRSADKAQGKVLAKIIGYDPERDVNWTRDDFYFWLLGMKGNRVLHKEGIKERLLKAVEDNDLNFFVRLGRELQHKPRDFRDCNRWELLLAFCWETGLGRIPAFHVFTDETLLRLFQEIGWPHLTLDLLRKTRQRLGLFRARQAQVRGVELVGKNLRLVWWTAPKRGCPRN